MVSPIRPEQVEARKQAAIPVELIAAVNDLIVKHWDGSRARVFAKDIVAAVADTYTAKELYAHRWMDFEPTFREAGWAVTYDQPGYNETYDASYTFTRA